ncbi:SPW repeat domain-containing protein [Natrinema salsiterrestre]|uniref:SPW repeat-containing integral membrane domain-containing protein n=1 Tax=Natrinema salsiterrestre TaxID=2950540 RepID=A0A9Q4Q1C3_9EURY|nr:hypothetical protein [Natrinema salsiterrestre]MDF9747074.1 hypothetical protein [Natrinema salsiterrestre]
MSRSADGKAALVVRTAGLTAALGAFVMVSTAVFTITDTMGIHNVIAGAIIAFVASVQAYRTDEQGSFSIAIPAVLAVLGIWIAIAPILLFDVQRDLVLGINGVSGVLIVILSLAGVYGTVQTSNATATSA